MNYKTNNKYIMPNGGLSYNQRFYKEKNNKKTVPSKWKKKKFVHLIYVISRLKYCI